MNHPRLNVVGGRTDTGKSGAIQTHAAMAIICCCFRYNSTLNHFLALLRSSQFTKLLNETRQIYRHRKGLIEPEVEEEEVVLPPPPKKVAEIPLPVEVEQESQSQEEEDEFLSAEEDQRG